MTDELDEFLSTDSDTESNLERARPGITLDLLVFEYANDAYAVAAVCVAGIVPWKTPARVPGVDPRVAGVIQDRGRIVVLMMHPTGRHSPARADAKRIILCSTARGYVGLPASVTRTVGPVDLDCQPGPFSVHDCGGAPFTYLDPTAYPETR